MVPLPKDRAEGPPSVGCRVFYDAIYIEWSSRRRVQRSEQGGREKIEERDGLVSIDSRARKSVMRSRRGADAENIHHARGALISSRGSPLHNYILASSEKRPVDRTVASLISKSRLCVQLNGKMRCTWARTFLYQTPNPRTGSATALRYAEMDRACLINC